MVSNITFYAKEKLNNVCIDAITCREWALKQHLIHDLSIPLAFLVTTFIILMLGLIDKERRNYYMWISVPMVVASIFFCLQTHNIS